MKNMSRKPKQGGIPRVEKQVLLKLPQELHTEIKHRAVDEKTTIRGFIYQAILDALAKKRGRK